MFVRLAFAVAINIEPEILIVDEAHNFGAKRLQKCMLENFKYRLALSATLERHHDEEGTQSLYNYFKKVCITFTLEDAIKQGFLTPYYYHPVVVNLEPDELQEYTELTEKIINILRKNPGDELPKSAEMLLIKRSRIIAGARNKLRILEELMEEYKHDNNILVYCGATKYDNSELKDDEEVDFVYLINHFPLLVFLADIMEIMNGFIKLSQKDFLTIPVIYRKINDNIEKIRDSIETTIKSRDEDALIGLGVLFELL